MNSNNDVILLEPGWEKMKEGIDKFTHIMETDFRESFPLAMHSELYTLVSIQTVPSMPAYAFLPPFKCPAAQLPG